MTSPTPLPLRETLASLPPIHAGDLRGQTRQFLSANASSIPLLIALDDDPTGTQTCHDIPVLTVWDVPTLKAEFAATRAGSGFFILTNSRALHAEDARQLVTEICLNLKAASDATGKPFEVVLRGDSTLRGHFPDECDVVEEVLGEADAWVLAPFFLQGGRYTIGDVHYVAEGETLLPAGETPFARDATFGYKSSDLREWVEEKSKGVISRERVVGLDLQDIRVGGPARVEELLNGFSKGSAVVVNAAAEEDMDVVVLGLLAAAGKLRNQMSWTVLIHPQQRANASFSGQPQHSCQRAWAYPPSLQSRPSSSTSPESQAASSLQVPTYQRPRRNWRPWSRKAAKS